MLKLAKEVYMEINICFGINNEYCQHCACTMASILYNSNPQDKYHFYIITNYISQFNRECLKSLNYIRKFKTTFIYIDKGEFANLDVNNNLGTSTFFRFKALQISKIKKLIYLDVDIIVRKDIAELYNENVDNYYFAGVEDIIAPVNKKDYDISPESNYVNAGVLLFNMEYCRKNNALNKLMNFIHSPWDKKWNDQHIINYVFQNKIKLVDITWNHMYCYTNYYDLGDYYHDLKNKSAIIHFITEKKPWLPQYDVINAEEYFKYLKMTPYYKQFIYDYKFDAILHELKTIKSMLKEQQ